MSDKCIHESMIPFWDKNGFVPCDGIFCIMRCKDCRTLLLYQNGGDHDYTPLFDLGRKTHTGGFGHMYWDKFTRYELDKGGDTEKDKLIRTLKSKIRRLENENLRLRRNDETQY